jgi:GNAT superfamily N-acetyltransferase
MNIEIHSKAGEKFVFRKLDHDDSVGLGLFFENLDDETKSRFGPHPLTREYASLLCHESDKETTLRFIVKHDSEVIGYFILDFNEYRNEIRRYGEQCIEINSEIDPVFAPCIAKTYQNSGISTQCMKQIVKVGKSRRLRRIVLMGGTQVANLLAISFYKKCGFREHGTFYTDYNKQYNIDMSLELESK